MNKDKTNIEEIKIVEQIRNLLLDNIDFEDWREAEDIAEKVLKLTKDQVRAECEKYLDEFFELLVDKGYIEKGEVYIHAKSWVKKFKKEQREHE